MHTFFKTATSKLAFAAILSFVGIGSALAQNTSADDSIYQGLGAKAGIDKIVGDFIPLVLGDERINRFFTKVNTKQLAGLLSDQFCELAGGPCQYKGRDMYETHEGMEISNAHFNALAEDLQIAMEKNNISTSVANKLVAKLAPMQRPIVSK
jgi:hemoglobin